MATRRKVGNLTALALLALLAAGRPMHPYEMAVLLRRTGKEQDMKIKWGSLYTVVQNLDKHGFITAVETGRSGRRPERTRYAITDAGRAELHDWLSELVADPGDQPGRFTAALSVLGALPPDEVITLLEQRLHTLNRRIDEETTGLAEMGTTIPRLFLVESEYALALRRAEADWTRALLAEMTEGRLPGLADWRSWHETGETPPGWAQLLTETGMDG